jgi:hypothetical protein
MNFRSRFAVGAAIVLTVIVLAVSVRGAVPNSFPFAESTGRPFASGLRLHPFILLFPALHAALMQ